VRAGVAGILRVELTCRAGAVLGMRGSGLLLLNPPWRLRDALAPVLPWLAGALAPDASSYRLEWLAAP